MPRKPKTVNEIIAEKQAELAAMAPAVERPTLPAYDRAALATVRGTWEAALAELGTLPCETPEQEAWWAGKLNEAQQLLNAVESDRKALVDPLNRDLKQINGDFKPATVALEEAKALISRKLSEAATERGRLAASLRDEAAARAGEGDHAGCQAALAAIAEDVKVSGVATVWSWTATIADAAAVPREWCRPDEEALKAYCKAYKDSVELPAVPGVKFERIAKVQPRGGK